MELAQIFGDNMVLQAEKPVYFFGMGKGKVAIALNGKNYEQDFSGDKWVMELPAQPYGGPLDITVDLSGEKRVLKEVAFGDVFLCAGQSNMQFIIAEEKGASPIKEDGKIRYFYADNAEKNDGAKSSYGWLKCENGLAQRWSALGTHIAQYYREKHDVYVGIIGCFQGASSIRSWLPSRALDESVFVPLALRHGDHTHEIYGAWNGDSYLYERTFSPFVPYGVKEVIWYQGESNTTLAESKVYTQLLRNLIKSWREDLRDGSLPFTVVEICDFDGRNDEAWRAIQACQQEIPKLEKNVQTVTSKDVCEHSNIHPANKEKLAKKIFVVLA